MKKKSWLWGLLVLLSGLLVWWGANHDEQLYHQAIVEVVAVKNGKTETTVDDYQNKDATTTQKLTVKLINTKHRGRIYHVTNTYSKSQAQDQRYYVGQKIFVNHTGSLLELAHYKRDQYLFILIWLVVVVLLAIMRLPGLRALLAVILNFAIFMLTIQLDVALNLSNFLALFVVAAVIFLAVSLALILGVRLQFWLTFSSIVLGVAGGLGLGLLAMALTNNAGMHYEALDFATQSPQQLFIAETLIGLLGTVMDAATDIIATLVELKSTQPTISRRQLFRSGHQVGQAIMGPLINVLLLIFFTETFTMAVLYFKTGNTFAYTFQWTMELGLAQAVISGLGIALVIPAASWLGAWALSKRKQVAA